MTEEYYVRYHVTGFGEDPLVRYAGPYDFVHVAEEHQRDIAGFTDISDCIVITKAQFEMDQVMTDSKSS